MSLVALNLPENTHDWPDWLERQIVGLELRNLVRQLEFIGGLLTDEPPLENNLDSIIGERRDALLALGLGSLSEIQLILLIRQPRLLLDLQELVLQHGGEYWNNVERSPEHESFVVDEKKRLSRSIADSLLQSEAPKTVESRIRRPADAGQRRSLNPVASQRQTWLLLAAAIAAVVLIAFLPKFMTERHDGRFFAHRELLNSSLKNGDFLRQVAKVVSSDWEQNSKNKDALEKQLIDFRDSCDVLLAANLLQVDTTVAAEFKKRCQIWREKIVRNIDQLASNTPFSEVQTEANATIGKLLQFLNELAG